MIDRVYFQHSTRSFMPYITSVLLKIRRPQVDRYFQDGKMLIYYCSGRSKTKMKLKSKLEVLILDTRTYKIVVTTTNL